MTFQVQYKKCVRLTLTQKDLHKAIQNLVEHVNLGLPILHRVEAVVEHAECHHKLHVAFPESWLVPVSESSGAPTRNHPR